MDWTAEQIAFKMVKEMNGLHHAYESTYNDCFMTVAKKHRIEFDEKLKSDSIAKAKLVFEIYSV